MLLFGCYLERRGRIRSTLISFGGLCCCCCCCSNKYLVAVVVAVVALFNYPNVHTLIANTTIKQLKIVIKNNVWVFVQSYTVWSYWPPSFLQSERLRCLRSEKWGPWRDPRRPRIYCPEPVHGFMKRKPTFDTNTIPYLTSTQAHIWHHHRPIFDTNTGPYLTQTQAQIWHQHMLILDINTSSYFTPTQSYIWHQQSPFLTPTQTNIWQQHKPIFDTNTRIKNIAPGERWNKSNLCKSQLLWNL